MHRQKKRCSYPALLDGLHKNQDDDQERWLLAIYDDAHRDATRKEIAEASTETGLILRSRLRACFDQHFVGSSNGRVLLRRLNPDCLKTGLLLRFRFKG